MRNSSLAADFKVLKAISLRPRVNLTYSPARGYRTSYLGSLGLSQQESSKIIWDLHKRGLLIKKRRQLIHPQRKSITAYTLSPQGFAYLKELGL